MIRRSFLSLASLAPSIFILIPEPRKAYSFLWARETERERLVRQCDESIRKAIMGNSIFAMPPGVSIEMIPGDPLRTRTLTARVKVQPLNWDHAMRLRAEGFEFA